MAETREERILIVDDEEINRAILANIFESDYQIVEAENGQEGLERIQDLGDGLSAVLLDVVMPEVDGIEVLRRMHRKGFTQQVPFFLITAAQDNATIQEAYSLGVMDVIGKPVVPYVVQRRVDSVVAGSLKEKGWVRKWNGSGKNCWSRPNSWPPWGWAWWRPWPPPLNSEAMNPGSTSAGFTISPVTCCGPHPWGRA